MATVVTDGDGGAGWAEAFLSTLTRVFRVDQMLALFSALVPLVPLRPLVHLFSVCGRCSVFVVELCSLAFINSADSVTATYRGSSIQACVPRGALHLLQSVCHERYVLRGGNLSRAGIGIV